MSSQDTGVVETPSLVVRLVPVMKSSGGVAQAVDSEIHLVPRSEEGTPRVFVESPTCITGEGEKNVSRVD